jgi:beta-galactosidase
MFSRLFLFQFFWFLFLCNTSLHAQQRIQLNNHWEFIRQDLGGVWEAVREVGKGNPESVPLWDSVTLPHCYNAIDAVDPDVNYYQGPAWYRTNLKVDNPYENGRALLHFEGVGQKAEVYIYTTKVGSHVGGYDEWSVDITDAVAEFQKTEVYHSQFKDKIPLSIRVNNSRDLEMIPSNLSDFNLYGGIYRYLNLVYEPILSLDKVFAFASVDSKGKTGSIKVSGRFYNPLKISNALVQLNLIDPKGKVIQLKKITIDKPEEGSVQLQNFEVKNPQLWSPDKPFLYSLEIIVKAYQIESKHIEKIGFRNFEFVEKGPFMLNGKRLLLRGTHRHEDHAGVGAAMTEQVIRTEMKMMKDMGVNFIRLGHYQQSRIVLNLCDSLGIMVWEEIPWCRGGLGGDIYKEQARLMLTSMIEQHYNHPSIIIWGLGNENDWPGDFPEFDKEKIRTFMKELNDLSHSLDPSRMTAIRRCDFCKDIVDVYSPSIWAGWYRGIYNEYKESSEKEFNKVKRFFHAEWGGDSHARRHAENPDRALSKLTTGKGTDERAGDASLVGGDARISKDGDWSESYICNLIDWHLKEQETMPWLTGSAYWPFKDFSTPVRPENPVPYVNQKGVVERDFTKKEAYYVFQSYWTEKLMAHIYGHSWPVRWGEADEDKMVKVYSNGETAELFLNEKSYGVKKRSTQDFPAAGFHWQMKFKAGENHLRVIAKKGKETIQDEITFNYQTEKWSKPATLRAGEIKHEGDSVTIQVELLDGKNVRCLDAINWIRFDLTGDGALLDNLGTSTGARLVQAYNGRAVIQIKKNKGKSVVTVKSDTMPTVFVNIE